MQIDVERDNGTTIVRPAAPRIDRDGSESLRVMLVALIDQGSRNFVLDLQDVTYIDSSGIAAIMSALKTLRFAKREGDIRLARVQPAVRSLLDMLRLTQVFTVYDTVDDAITSYESPGGSLSSV